MPPPGEIRSRRCILPTTTLYSVNAFVNSVRFLTLRLASTAFLTSSLSRSLEGVAEMSVGVAEDEVAFVGVSDEVLDEVEAVAPVVNGLMGVWMCE